MPPIRGCFQTTMIICDRAFATMAHDGWCDGVWTKIQGSWNFHTALSGNSYFFIMSSSAGILRNTGQADYADGNIIHDALAHRRG